MDPEVDETKPELSVVLPSPERIALVMRTVVALATQTIADRIELILIVPDAADVPPRSMTAPLGWVRVVPMPTWTTMTAARVEGILRARAPIVALAEDHCFPAPGWAEALLAAHREPWAAVGPAFVNANPTTMVSWANLLIEYGPWLDPVAAGAVAHVPGHNSAYKRDLLLAYGPRLEAMLEAESVLHWDLQRQGHQVAMAPAAKSRHENFSLLAPSFALRFTAGRLFAASRAQAWPLWRRAVFAVGSPAIPFVRAWRTHRHVRRVPEACRRPGLGPVILALLVVDAIGECSGYALGVGNQARRISELEHNRPRFLAACDRDAVGS